MAEINEAQRKIAAILANLEKSQGVWIKGISLEDTDVTTSKDDRKQFIRSVRIDIDEQPGVRWET